MEIALYYAPNTCALAPYVTLTEAGADFEVRPLNFRKRQNFSPEYLKINPKHKVPALVVDGKILTENVAIHQWVHRTFPNAKLLPADPWDELKAVSLHAWCASGIHPYLSRINNPPKVCDATGASDSVIKFAYSRTSRSATICWPGVSTSSTISPPRTRISFGAAAAPPSWELTSQASPTSPRISSACKSARASRSCSPTRKK